MFFIANFCGLVLRHINYIEIMILALHRYSGRPRVTWGIAPPFGDDLSLTYLFASTSEKSYMYVTNYMLCV